MGFSRPFKSPGSGNLRQKFELRNLDFGAAVTEIARGRAKSFMVMLDTEQWARDLFWTLKDYAEKRTYGRFTPCDVTLIVGPNRIVDEESRKTIAESNLRVDLHGDGMPNNMEEYLEQFRQNEHIRKLLDFLKNLSGTDWDIIPIWS